MKGVLFFILAFSFCPFYAQENEFQNYLGHFREITAECSIESDSLKAVFTREVSDELARRYISEKSDEGTYYYGIKETIPNGVIVVVLQNIPDFQTKWGKGLQECWAIVYSPEGKKKSEMLLGTKSGGQSFRFSASRLTDIHVYETTLQHCFDRDKQHYYAAKYSKGYMVDKNGMLRYCSQFKVSDLKVEKRNKLKILEEHEVWKDIWVNYVKANPIK